MAAHVLSVVSPHDRDDPVGRASGFQGCR